MVVAAFTGNYVGLVISLPVSGILAAEVGWEWVFYVFGIIGCVWTVLWLVLIRRSPGRDPFISKAERDYIEQSLNKQSKDKAVEIPWKAIWTSSAVWAIIGKVESSNKSKLYLRVYIRISSRTVLGRLGILYPPNTITAISQRRFRL